MTTPATPGVDAPDADRSNNLDGLRLAGAIAVIVGHAYILNGAASSVPGLLGASISGFGVQVFFSISGYLIAESWLRRRDIVDFAAARMLRLVPALAVTVVVTVLVLGPLATTLPTLEYLTSPATWTYLANVAFYPVYALPGVFEGVPHPNAVNGSLWTLPVELACYAVVPLALLARRRSLQIAGAAAFTLLSVVLARVLAPGADAVVVYGTDVGIAASLWTYFGVGMLLRLAVARSALRVDVVLLAVVVQVVALQVAPSVAAISGLVVIPYAVLAVGLASTPVLRRASRFGDLSYGIYLWAFPIQQAIVALGGIPTIVGNVAAVLVLSAVLALASWHGVERHALRLRRVLARARRRDAVSA